MSEFNFLRHDGLKKSNSSSCNWHIQLSHPILGHYEHQEEQQPPLEFPLALMLEFKFLRHDGLKKSNSSFATSHYEHQEEQQPPSEFPLALMLEFKFLRHDGLKKSNSSFATGHYEHQEEQHPPSEFPLALMLEFKFLRHDGLKKSNSSFATEFPLVAPKRPTQQQQQWLKRTRAVEQSHYLIKAKVAQEGGSANLVVICDPEGHIRVVMISKLEGDALNKSLSGGAVEEEENEIIEMIWCCSICLALLKANIEVMDKRQ
ncbi:hypothetical protein Lser_V15G22787 [Lactuca serriola]